MTRVVITGCSSRFAQVLLPLLEEDPEVQQIVGLDLVPPVITRLRPFVVMGPHQAGLSLLVSANQMHFAGAEGPHERFQFVHEDDLASAFHVAIRHDLPGAYNVVGDGAETLPKIAAMIGLQVVEVPRDMLVAELEKLWKAGLSNAGPEWLWSEGSLICSNVRLKATGHWQPRYDTVSSCAATLAALS